MSQVQTNFTAADMLGGAVKAKTAPVAKKVATPKVSSKKEAKAVAVETPVVEETVVTAVEAVVEASAEEAKAE